MSPDNERKLAARIATVGETALARSGYVTAIDILLGIDWLRAAHVEDWRRARIPYLERAAIANLKKLGTALRLFSRWTQSRGLNPSETAYHTWTPDRRPLRFSKTGDRNVEQAYRTHWVSPTLRKEGRGHS
jgi:hypothetical protein